jgi:hypothetical protein
VLAALLLLLLLELLVLVPVLIVLLLLVVDALVPLTCRASSLVSRICGPSR